MQKVKIPASTNNLYSKLNEFCNSRGLVVIKESIPSKEKMLVKGEIMYKDDRETCFKIPYEFIEKDEDEKNEIALYGKICVKPNNSNIIIETEFFNDELKEGLELNKMENYLVEVIKKNVSADSKSDSGNSELDEAITNYKSNNVGDWRDDEGIKSLLTGFSEEINKYKNKEENLVKELVDFLSK